MKQVSAIFLIIACLFAGFTASARKSQTEEFRRKLVTLNAIVKELDVSYVDTLDASQLMDRTIGALLYQIDPYTEYYTDDNKDELLTISAGKYAGIGSSIFKRGDHIYINEPYWDSPARKYGLRSGDRILSVDDFEVKPGTPVDEVSKRLRGQAGTEVKVSVKRPYVADSMLTVTVVRDDIKIKPLPYHGVDDRGIGYIALTTFNDNSAEAVREAVLDLLADPRLKGIVIDLRDNGGGLLESAVRIASYFVPKGTEILRTVGRNADDTRVYKTKHSPLAPDIPLAILINEGTASSSEILAGSFQDLDRAVIVGERSFGKGLVQSARPLPYNELMKITTGRYYIPSGRLVQALDYSNRNADGSPTRTPDSLTHEFRTRAGRIVRDGGGITPDVTAEEKPASRLLISLATEFVPFDFTNKYLAEHQQNYSPDSEVVTDEVYEQFKAFVDPSKFNYDRRCETALKALREAAVSEGYMNDSVDAQLSVLADMLRHNLDRDLDRNRDEIVENLEANFAVRLFPDSDNVRRRLPSDSVLITAGDIILDSVRYSNILKGAE